MCPLQKSYKTVSSYLPEKAPVITGHDRFNPTLLTGSLWAKVHLCQPLHIGSGLTEPPEIWGLENDAQLIKTLFRVGNRICLPSTSLKGAFRSLVEIFTPSCAPGQRSGDYSACKPDRGNYEFCPACRIFGTLGFQGEVRFEDVVFPTNIRRSVYLIPPQYNSGKGAEDEERRYYPHALKDDRDKNWPIEVLDAGQFFNLKVSFSNITKADMGILLVALGQGKWQLCPKLGAGKGAGLGSVKLDDLQGKTMNLEASYSSFESQCVPLDSQVCLADAADLLDMETLDVLAKDLGWVSLKERCK